MPAIGGKSLRSLRSVGRGILEVLIASAALLYAAETYTHRLFSPDLRYRSLIVLLALVVATLGAMPLLFHFWPRVLRLSLVLLAAALAGLGILAVLHNVT